MFIKPTQIEFKQKNLILSRKMRPQATNANLAGAFCIKQLTEVLLNVNFAPAFEDHAAVDESSVFITKLQRLFVPNAASYERLSGQIRAGKIRSVQQIARLESA